MSKLQKRTLGALGLVVTIAALLTGVFVASPDATSPRRPVREVSLEARGAAFNGDNPTIEAKVGEKLRIVVRNTDPGVRHEIALPALGTGTHEVASGEEIVVEVPVDRPGTYQYVCPRHAAKMKGTIVVR
jgi:plastocyanin